VSSLDEHYFHITRSAAIEAHHLGFDINSVLQTSGLIDRATVNPLPLRSDQLDN